MFFVFYGVVYYYLNYGIDGINKFKIKVIDFYEV